MIEVISSWAKSLGVTIVLVSILEMILPNNKTKKYIRMVMGIFVIFNIISPFIQNKDKLSLASINIEDYYIGKSTNTSGSINSNNSGDSDEDTLNQTSMDERIKELYQEELEKDITKKVEEQGYKVSSCKVQAEVPTKESQQENETGITKIELKIKEKVESENSGESTGNNADNQGQEESIENKIVIGVQRIKEVDVSGDGVKKQQNENDTKDETNNKVTRSDIQNIKKFLIEEYGVSEKCLEIN